LGIPPGCCETSSFAQDSATIGADSYAITIASGQSRTTVPQMSTSARRRGDIFP